MPQLNTIKIRISGEDMGMRTSRNLITIIGVAAVGLLTCGACATQNAAPAPPSASPPSSTAPGPGAISVPLASAPTGTATLSWNPTTKQITAAIDAYGFTPASAHAMHIHPGTCANQNQPPSIPFPDVKADPSGVAKESLASQPAPAGIPTNSYLNIHLAPMAQLGAPTDVSFTPILCADIPSGTAATGPVRLKLHAPQHGTKPSTGSAALTYNGATHTLRVVITATGLVPNTAHAVHIHSGNCQNQGDVLYPLPDLRSNATGDAQDSATITNVTTAPPATGWYVNVHFGPMSQILNGGKPTLLFAPILCGNIAG